MVAVALVAGSPPAYAPDAGLTERASVLRTRIDPNVDPWWKLAALPGIGVTRAKAIVRFRQVHPETAPFKTARDLTDVHGIGPKTAARSARYLRLPPVSSPPR